MSAGPTTQALRFGIGMVAASCSSASAPPEATVMQIVTTAAQYAPGAQVSVRFTNLSSTIVYYNDCNGYIDLKMGAAWVAVGQAAGSWACPDYLLALQAGASDTSVFPLAAAIFPGVYRYRLTGVYGPDRSLLPEWERVSNSFSVMR